MEKVEINQLVGLFASIAKQMTDNADLLCEMDSVMGDGDLGLTMPKGYNAMPGILEAIDEADFSKKIAKAGMKMGSVVPSTMGTLMSSGIMSGGKKLASKDCIDDEGLALFLEGFCEGIVKRGKCAEGERTVLDAFAPAARAARAAVGQGLNAAASAALKGAEEGLEATKNMMPKYGKAAVHAAKAAGRVDQGAYAGMLVVKGIAEYING